MSHASRSLLACGLGVTLVVVAHSAQAAEPLAFLFSGHGQISFAECPSPSPTCSVATVVGAADDWTGLSSPITGNWKVKITRTLDLANMSFTGTFVFFDEGPSGNSLHGSLTGAWRPHSPGYTRGQNFFTVLGGTGIFSGASGTGENTVYTHSATGHYVDSGKFSVALAP